jgi:Tol biopolymer transport system component/DNA-binding winged helix-turn-helix (wHTH) protein
MFDTLFVLVENADRLVEKDDLMRKVWHDRFVEENNLSFNIKMLRKALGDKAASPTYIETVPRRGFRFIAEVKVIGDDRESGSIIIQPKENALISPKTYLFAALLLLITLFGSLGFTSWLWQKKSYESTVPILSTGFDSTRISDTGNVHHAVISSDGKYVAYTNQVNSKQSIWLRHLETANNTPILPPSDDLYFGLAFSHDGETLFFTRQDKEKIKPVGLYRIPLSGGVPARLAENCQGWISVAPDDRQISFVRYETGVSDSNKLMMVDVDGQNERELKASESPNVFWANAFSSDGKTIAAAYGHSRNASQKIGLVEVNVKTGEQRELTSKKFFQVAKLEWLPNQRGLIVSGSENINAVGRIWRLDYDNGKIEQITNDSVSYDNLSLNKNADKLAVTTLAADFHLCFGDVHNTSPNSIRCITQARDGLAFTSDGRIVYASDTAGNEDIWITDLDGSNQRQLTNNQGLDSHPLVSADNRYIFFRSNRTGESQVWRMNIDGSNQTQVTRKKGGYPRFLTPDGKFLYHQSDFTNDLMKVSIDDGNETPVGENLGYCQAFSPDGNRLAYLYKDKRKHKINIMDLGTRKILRTLDGPESTGFVSNLRWRNNDALGYSIDEINAKDSIWSQNLNDRFPQLLYEFSDADIMDIQFSADGKHIAFIRGGWKHDAFLLKGLK